MTAEQLRAKAWEEQQRRRERGNEALLRRLRGSDAAFRALYLKWRPVIKGEYKDDH